MQRLTAKELKRRYRAGERNFAGVDLSGESLRGMNLKGIDLSGADLSRTDIRGTNFTKANLVSTQFFASESKSMQVNDNSRNISIGGNATGNVFQTGDGNTASIEFQQVTLPPPDRVNIQPS